MNEKIIVSMTSYPARIKYVSKVWYSILKQIKPEYNCTCVLVLSKTEFPNLQNDLPEDLNILVNNNLVEILWTETNIRSHKKLMPVLTKYPNEAILIIDDDQYRPNGWLKIFIEDHKKWPNDVIAGMIHYRLNEKTGHFYWSMIQDSERGSIITNGRSANGRGGTLYPANTFKDKEFFDEQLYMKLSPFSDESWQFYWLHKNGIHPRATSNWIKDLNLVIKEAQDMPTALWNINNGKYDEIYENIKNYFSK